MSIEQFPVPSASSGTVTSVAGGVGITNTPEPIVGAGTVDLDINSLTSETTVSAGDLFPFVDVSVGTTPAAQRKATLANVRIALQGDLAAIREQWWQVENESNGTVTSAGNTAAATVTGTSTVFSDSTGQYQNRATLAGGVAGWTATAGVTQRQFLPDMTVVMKTGPAATDITNCRIWAMLIDNTGDQAVAVPANAFGFRFNTPESGDTTWKIFSSAALGTNTVVDTGITVVVDTRYVFRIRFSAATVIEYSINGVVVGTISGAGVMPGAAVPLFWQSRLVNGTVVTRSIRNSKIYVIST